MDLTTIFDKLDGQEYEDVSELDADFRLMLNNCRTFNPSESVAVVCANKLEEVWDEEWISNTRLTASDKRKLVTVLDRLTAHDRYVHALMI